MKQILSTLPAIIISCFIAGCAIFNPQPDYLTVSEVWQNAEELDQQQVVIRGYGSHFHAQTVQKCFGIECGCNEAWEELYLVNSLEDAFYNSGIKIVNLDCRGDECSVTCRPFNPNAALAFEIVGTLKVVRHDGEISRLELTNIDFEASSYLSDGADLTSMTKSPLLMGDFTQRFTPPPEQATPRIITITVTPQN